jgi:hypothetical protein
VWDRHLGHLFLFQDRYHFVLTDNHSHNIERELPQSFHNFYCDILDTLKFVQHFAEDLVEPVLLVEP